MELCLVDFSVESVYYLDAPDVWAGEWTFADWKIYRCYTCDENFRTLDSLLCELRFCTPVHHNSFTFYMKLREKRLLMLLDLASESMFASVFLLGEES